MRNLESVIYDAVFEIVAASLFQKNVDMHIMGLIDSYTLYDELKRQTILSLPARILPQVVNMSETLYMRWRSETIAQISMFCNYMKRQDELLQAFQESYITCVVLKGAVSASYYPVPAYRQMGDIDLLVHKKDQEETVKLLLSLGFKEFGYRDEQERTFQKNGFVVEIHIGFDSQKRSNTVSQLDEFLFAGMDQIQYRQIMQYTVPALPEEQNGIVLLEHMRRHLRDGLGLRQVIDWMMYVDRFLDDRYWTEHMQVLTEKFGLKKFAIIITAMCQQYLGLDKDRITWCRNADAKICRELIYHILSMGNFGNKLEENEKGLAKLLRYRSPLWLCKNLQRIGLENWSAVRKYPILKPFAWIYQIGRYLSHALSGEYNMSLSLVWKDRKRTAEASDLMRKLGL